MYNWFFFLALFTASGSLAQQPIKVQAQQVINLATQGNAYALFDEQDKVGNPRLAPGAEPTTAFSAGHNQLYNPASVVIDFREDYQLQEIWFYDGNGKDTIRLYSGVPGNWQLQQTIITDAYRQWRSLPLNFKSRLLRMEFRWPQAQVNEVVLYGKALGTNQRKAPAAIKMKQPSMDKLIGLNAFVDDPLEKLTKLAGTLREYHRWQWDEADNDASYQGFPQGKFAWNPSYAGNWNFDAYYRHLHQAGVDVSPCLQSQPLYMRAGENADGKPLKPGLDAEDPFSYREHADYLFQFAARYGGKKVSPELLKLRANQPVRSGLGYIHALENWNEPDKWWRGPAGYFSPFEFAAMCSADYDGHLGKMGPTYGLKNADAALPMVMGGLASLNLEYLKGMLLWTEFRREGSFPADVLNFHHYSNDAGGQGGNPSRAVSPEEDRLKEKLREVVRFRDEYLPGKKIWLSEFGYDTNVKSVQGVRGDDPEEKQAQWLLRSFLEIAASGIDRAQLFMFRDVNAPNPVKYNSSGLANEKWNRQQPKKSYYYLAGFKSLLHGFYFKREIATRLEKLNRYEFYNPTSGETIWAIWSYDEQDSELRQVSLKVSGENLELIRLQPDSTSFTAQSLKHAGDGQIEIEVGLMPVFLRFR